MFTVEQQKLVEMKRDRESRSEERVGDEASTEKSQLQANQEEHPPLSPMSPLSSALSPVSSPISLVSPPVSPISSPLSPVSSTGDQVQTTLPRSPPPKQSG